MTILLTGGAGMLGKAISASLVSKGISHLSPLRSELELRDFAAISNYLKTHQISKIIHCAAKVGGIKFNKENPGEFLLQNLQIDSCVLKAAQEHGVIELIYMSSSCSYPIDAPQPYIESSLKYGNFEPTNRSYAIAKMTALEAISALNSQFNLSFRALILSNLYGPNDNFLSENSHLISAALRKCENARINNEESVEIWGSGKPRREFTYVLDVAEWITNQINNIASLPERINIGFGRDYSVSEYYELAAKTVGYKGKFTYNEDLPDGIFSKLMSSEIANRDFSWDPKTSIEEGMLQTYRWWLEGLK